MRVNSGTKLALRFIFVQSMISVVVVFITALAFGKMMAMAALAGATINLAANGYFALVSLKLVKGTTPGRVLGRFYIGELGKFFIIVVGFAWVFRDLPEISQGQYAIVLFVAFLITQVAYVVTPLVLKDSF